MARCPDCNKFVSFEQGEPEENNSSVTYSGGGEGEVEVEVRIVNNCAECGTEMTEATLEMSGYFKVPEGWRDEDELDAEGNGLAAHDDSAFEVEVVSTEATTRSEGKGRGTRTFYGASVVVSITHPDFPDWSSEDTLEGEEQASSMESLN